MSVFLNDSYYFYERNIFSYENFDSLIEPISSVLSPLEPIYFNPNAKNNNTSENFNQKTHYETKISLQSEDGLKNQKTEVITPKNTNKSKENGNKEKFKEIIFKIIKIKRKNNKKGRMKNILKQKFFCKHNEFSSDNVRGKIINNFIIKIMNYVNKQYSIFMNGHKKKKVIKLLQRINIKKCKSIKKEDTNSISWFDLKLKEILSSDLSKKCASYPTEYNKNIIEDLYKNNKAKNITDILDRPVKELYKIYIEDNIVAEGFSTLRDDLDYLRTKMKEESEEDIQHYLDKYAKIAKNMEQFYQ